MGNTRELCRHIAKAIGGQMDDFALALNPSSNTEHTSAEGDAAMHPQFAAQSPSHGRTGRRNTRLKLVKRWMYGRAKLDLLETHFLGAT